MTKNKLMELDRQFDLETSTGGLEVWVSYFAEYGVMVMGQSQDRVGKESIRQAMKPAFELPGFSLRWKPLDADISEDGTLGYTYGSYVRTYRNEAGERIEGTGKYTSVWKKQSDGQWKIVLDIGN